MNGAESLPLIEGAATTAKTEPVLAKGLVGGADGLGGGAPANLGAARIDINRTMRNAGLKEQDPSENAKLKAEFNSLKAILDRLRQALPGNN